LSQDGEHESNQDHATPERINPNDATRNHGGDSQTCVHPSRDHRLRGRVQPTWYADELPSSGLDIQVSARFADTCPRSRGRFSQTKEIKLRTTSH
jgi:hypothetical protein